MTVDGRRARGDATRLKVARQAAMTATVSGLDSITVGTLAEQTGVSKSGILTVFPNREAIQLAAVAEAREMFLEHVVLPVWNKQPGRKRLRAFIDSWVQYVRDGVFPGGCFVAIAAVEFGTRDGVVPDAVRALKREWLDALATEFRVAGSANPEDDAFKVDAFLAAGSSNYELFDDARALTRARKFALEVIG